MSARRPHTIVLAIALATAVGCSLAVGTSDIDRGCGAGKKWCADSCVDLTNPAYGCNNPQCDSCNFVNAVTTCDEGGNCQVKSCLKGWAICGSIIGCEFNTLADPQRCGSCDNVCPTGQVCAEGTCVPPTP